MSNVFSLAQARQLDRDDPLKRFRDQFHLPYEADQQDVYFVGNSLGLQPKSVSDYLALELESWQRLGVRGHFSKPRPWLNYHQLLTETMAGLVGGTHDEVIVMNTLTVNLHLMMATFFQPNDRRNKILIEAHAFPSDKNAVQSQLQLHGLDPNDCLIEIEPDDGELFSTDSVIAAIRQHRDSLALVLLPGVQYYTGQVFDMQAIAAEANELEIPIGFDLAHAAGNISLSLHDWNVDFACWCTYKYLNSGPGAIAGCFVHERHATNINLPRLAGWWGHDEKTRFQMTGDFHPIASAEGWQLSNPPILSAAAIRASLDIFKEVGGMPSLLQKSKQQQQFFRNGLQERLAGQVTTIAPLDQSGCQLSLEIVPDDVDGKQVFEQLESAGLRTDWREPNVIRAAPTPLYNTFEEIWRFVDRLAQRLDR
jgi:kynureninase